MTTVAELIAQLQTFDPHLEVLTGSAYGVRPIERFEQYGADAIILNV